MNIRKIMGADAGSLRFLTASEAPCFAMLSFVLGLIIVAWFSKSDFSSFFTADLSPEHNLILLAIIGLAGIVLAIIFGFYPARKVVSYPPVMALSGSFAQSKQSAALRNALIIIQFTAAIVLICVSGFIKLQHDYMTNQSWGFEKDHVLYLPFINADMSKTYETEIRQNPAIEGVTLSNSIPGTVNQRWGATVDNRDVSFAVWLVRPDFLDFFGINVISGRDFITDDEGKMRVVCNEAFMKKFDFEKIEGAKMDSRGFEFVGVVKDVNFESLHTAINPLCIITADMDKNAKEIFIRISSENRRQTLDFLKEKWEKLTDEPFNPIFLDDHINGLYKSENTLARLISVFGLIAVIIAVMGVYGLITFNARYRAREIAIRKVNGSSVSEIMLLLNRGMLAQLAVAYIVAVPLIYVIVSRWLSGFAYKTPIYWWVFAAGGAVVLAVTAATVAWQSGRAARRNPVRALNRE
jgi:putative ABC transport system permease protein